MKSSSFSCFDRLQIRVGQDELVTLHEASVLPGSRAVWIASYLRAASGPDTWYWI